MGCHATFERRSQAIAQGDAPASRRRRVRPRSVDVLGEHDMRCKFAFTLARHNGVQRELQRLVREAGVHVERCTVWELRAGAGDRSQKQADLLLRGWEGAASETLLDVGITHSTIGTLYNNSKPWRGRGVPANKYAGKKERGYMREIVAKQLPYSYTSFVVETYGAFGKAAWSVIRSLCDPATHPKFEGDYNAWSNPNPLRDFHLSIGFAIQRGNARMLQRCASRRAGARGSYSSQLFSCGSVA